MTAVLMALEKGWNIFLTVCSVLAAYRAVYYVLGFLTKERKYPPAKKLHSYGIVIAARNEEKVIGKLLQSIARQDYDPSLIKVYVVADNCTDRTAEVAREAGATVYERHDPTRARKGYALEFLFGQIARDDGIASRDAYIIFDADNLLARDFVTEINKAFDEGGDIAVGYRDTKNFSTNWISAAYGFHFYGSTLSMHRPRRRLGLSTHIAGTGYAVSSRLLKDGWHWTCLTEDTQFCLSQIANGVRVDYCEAAVFYDEQPHTLRVMFRQRIRWAKGRLACFFLMAPRLVKGIFTAKGRKFSCYDMLFYIFPQGGLAAAASLLFALATFAADLAAAPLATLTGIPAALAAGLLPGIKSLLLTFAKGILQGVLTAVRERRHIRCSPGRLALYILLWPLFDELNGLIFIIALFTRVRWKPIRHDKDIAITELEGAKKGLTAAAEYSKIDVD